ncbi:MAG: conjugal transfer protein TraG N-terminal domain-containing protein [bacterium]
MTTATFDSEYGLVNSSIYNMSTSASNELMQMTAVNAYNGALIAAANLSGNNATALSYGTALAQQNMSNSFAVSGELAGEYMPVVYGIFMALFVAFSLILIILMALPVGVNYLKMYMELALFLAVWPVLMAVYNYIDDLIIQHGFTLSLAGQGYSLSSAHSVNLYVSSQLGWMGYLSWSVPMMAYALVSGSTYAMVGAISSMDSAGKSAAQTGGAAAATGNAVFCNQKIPIIAK